MKRLSIISIFFSVIPLQLYSPLSFSIGNTQNTIPGWVLVAPPKKNNLYCASYSDKAWQVEWVNNSLQVNPRKKKPPIELDIPLPMSNIPSKIRLYLSAALKLNNGYLIGFDHGEWGGKLLWVNHKGAELQELLAKDNVVKIVNTSVGPMIFVGLSHESYDYGRVFLFNEDTKQLRLLADLYSAPRAFVKESEDNWLILTSKQLLRIKPPQKPEILKNVKFDYLDPNSMVQASNGTLYAGMRHYVTRWTPKGSSFSEEWLAPEKCPKFKLKEGRCVCKSMEQ